MRKPVLYKFRYLLLAAVLGTLSTFIAYQISWRPRIVDTSDLALHVKFAKDNLMVLYLPDLDRTGARTSPTQIVSYSGAAPGRRVMTFDKDIMTIDMSTDGSTVVNSDSTLAYRDNHDLLYVKSLKNGQLIRTIASKSYAVALSNDGSQLAGWTHLGSKPDVSLNRIYIWESGSGRLLRTLFTKHRVRKAAFSYSGRLMASVSEIEGKSRGYQVDLWNLQDGQLLRSINVPTSRYILTLEFSPDDRMLAFNIGPTVRVYNVPSATLKCNLQAPEGSIRSLDISPDNRTLAVGRFDNTVSLWDIDTASLMRVMTVPRARDGVTDCAFSKDGSSLATAGGGVYVWRIK